MYLNFELHHLKYCEPAVEQILANQIGFELTIAEDNATFRKIMAVEDARKLRDQIESALVALEALRKK